MKETEKRKPFAECECFIVCFPERDAITTSGSDPFYGEEDRFDDSGSNDVYNAGGWR